MNIKLGDVSASNGSDPWQAGFDHHSGHGHLGNRVGIDVDFRYLNSDGNSFRSVNAFKSKSYNLKNNQSLYNSAVKYDFTKNFQGLSGNINGPSKIKNHNNHGHLGLQYKNLDWKYIATPPTID